MRKSDARQMLGEAFGPGDLAEKLNEIKDSYQRVGFEEFYMEDAESLMDWMAEQLADEGEEDADSQDS